MLLREKIYLMWIGFIPILLSAQTEKKNSPVDFSVQFKSMHLWRGLEVSPCMTFASDIHISDRNGRFKTGLWGGAAANGSFKEIDYYLSFSEKGLTIALWDIYNFSPAATYNNREAFNYKAKETGHFVDLSASYRFQGNIPLLIGWATILYGRDRDIKNRYNRYSSYICMEYPVWESDFIQVDAGIGAALALRKGKDLNGNKTEEHFYGKTAGIVNINLTLYKDLKFGNYTLPVSAMVMWNPENNYANIQLAVTIF